MVFYSRKPTRIPGFDYSSPNCYFVTICAFEKQCIFGTAKSRNAWGQIAYEEMENIESHFPNVRIDNFIIMPNHVHAIIVMDGKNRVNLNHIIGLYKSGATRRIRQEQPDAKVWQRSYHDHIIRNQKEYEKIWQYVRFNDQKWEQDCFYPESEDK